MYCRGSVLHYAVIANIHKWMVPDLYFIIRLFIAKIGVE